MMLLPALGSCLIRALGASYRIRFDNEPERRLRESGEPVIYALWHEMLLALAYTHRRRSVCLMISSHRDGELIAGAARPLGYRLVRGSTTRGAASAVKALVRQAEAGRSIAVTPDGPRGPRREAQAGAAYLAARTGLPILPIAMAASACWRAGSWDRFMVPLPFSRVVVAVGEPLRVGASGERGRATAELQRRLEATAARAEVAARCLTPSRRRLRISR